MDIQEKLEGLLLGSFVADALALGVHWEYDTGVLQKKYGKITQFLDPGQNPYHAQKQLGELTHYGDQSLILLKSLIEDQAFKAAGFSKNWQNSMENYSGYLDHATKTTLANLAKGQVFFEAGSNSDELGGAARIAPLIFFYYKNGKRLGESVKEQTFLTHNHPLVVEAAVFISRVAVKILNGEAPVFAIEDMLAQEVAQQEFKSIIQEGIRSVSMDSMSAVKRLGQSCPVKHALAAAIHFVVKYEDSFEDALIMNVMAGGDSAARGMVIGMFLGAALGKNAIPSKWLKDLKAFDVLNQFIH